MKKKINPPPCLIEVWEKNFHYEQSKFINATYLKQTDLNSHFFDSNGDPWEIIGQMENGDIVCKNDKSGVYYIWDKWKVSQLKYPEKHVVEKVSKNLRSVGTREEKKQECKQLSLVFDEPKEEIKEEEVIVDDTEIESIDLDEVDIPIEDDELTTEKEETFEESEEEKDDDYEEEEKTQ